MAIKGLTMKRELGSGSFGSVWLAFDQTARIPVAVKTEDPRDHFLDREYKLYKALGVCMPTKQFADLRRRALEDPTDSVHLSSLYFPAVFELISSTGTKGMSMQLLAGTVADAVKSHKDCALPAAAVASVARGVLTALESLHVVGYVHRDLKPTNVGLGAEIKKVYLFDLGLAGRIQPYSENHRFVGTDRFASMSAHLGVSCTKRDDIEALCYTLVFLATGALPWQNVAKKCSDKRIREAMILAAKCSVGVEEITDKIQNERLGKAVFTMLAYSRSMSYDAVPDYNGLRALFDGFGDYDWSGA